MSASQLREKLEQRMLDEVREARFPSTAMLNRLESSISDRETLESYAEMLVEKAGDTRFPSTDLLNRIDGVLGRLEQEERRERAARGGD
jgi:uncharacterized protein (DUF2342 family)